MAENVGCKLADVTFRSIQWRGNLQEPHERDISFQPSEIRQVVSRSALHPEITQGTNITWRHAVNAWATAAIGTLKLSPYNPKLAVLRAVSPCSLMVRVPSYRTELYCVSCEVRAEFIYVMLKKIDRLCGLVVRIPIYRTEMYCVSCEVRTEFIYVMLKKVDRLCGLVVRVSSYRSEIYCVSCDVRTKLIYVR
jgi:hypothetical protein